MGLVFIGGTVGYWLLGLSPVDAAYQTVTTVTTVGFREVGEFGAAEKIFTMLLIIVGVGTVLYTFSLVMQMVVEGQLQEIVGRRRMDKKIADLRGHVVLCGWGRVGRAVVERGSDDDVDFVDGLGCEPITVATAARQQ